MLHCARLAQAESLSGLWSAIHAEAGLIVSEDEVHYLRGLALALDNDLVSHLLLRKLRIARIVAVEALPPDTVLMNSFVDFVIDGGDRRFGQIVHPSPCPPDGGVSVASLVGAGLLAVRKGQTILWPTQDGGFSELHVVHVENGVRAPKSARKAGDRT